MEFRRAKTAGFSCGVDHAVKMAFDALEENRSTDRLVFSYGSLIHNEAVIQRLTAEGLRVVTQLEEIRDYCNGDTTKADVIIRAHGVGNDVYEQLNRMGCRIIDATKIYLV